MVLKGIGRRVAQLLTWTEEHEKPLTDSTPPQDVVCESELCCDTMSLSQALRNLRRDYCPKPPVHCPEFLTTCKERA